MRRASPAVRLAAALLALALLLGGGLRLRAAAETDKGVVADLLSRALSSDTSNVSIGAVEGALSSDVTIRDVAVADANGTWLKLDEAHLVWNRLALLQRKLDVESLDIGKLEILRRPQPNAKAEAAGPILPELPLKVIVKALNLHRLALGAPLLGVAAEFTASGQATLGPPAEGLDLEFDARRLDAEGAFDLRLAFVPSVSQLTLRAKFDEPSGGLCARLAHLPGLPPVDLTIDGDGPLDAFAAKLEFAAGPEIGADGRFGLARHGAGRRLTAELSAHVAGLLPPVASDVFSGETALDASVNLGDDGALAIDKLSLTSATSRLEVSGAIDAARQVALNLRAEALPGAPHVGAFTFTAKASGALDAMSLDARAEAREARFDFGRLSAFDADFHLHPSGALGDPSTSLAFDGEAKANGLALADPTLAAALGGKIDLALKGDATRDGVAHFATLTVTTDGATASFVGDASATRVAGKANFSAPDLSRFDALGRPSLGGAMAAETDFEVHPREGWASATLDAQVTRFASGIAVLDGFAGGRLALSGGVSRLDDGGYAFRNLRLEGAHGSALIDGEAATDAMALHAEIDVPEVGALDARASGRGTASADFRGTRAHLDGFVDATLHDGRLLGRDTPRLSLSAALRDITGLPRGEAMLDGHIDARPATGAAKFAERADGGFDLDGLSLTLGSARIDGDLALQPDHTARGHLAITSATLDDLSPLVLTKLGGALDARLDLAVAGGRQDVAIRASSASLAVGGAEIAGLDVDVRAKDVFGEPSVIGHATVAALRFGEQTVSGAKVTATQAARGSDIALALSARGIDLQAQGLLAAGARQFTLARLQAKGAGRLMRLLKPALLSWDGASVDIDALALGVDSGKLTLAGRAGATLDLKLAATALPLAALDMARPGLGLGGALDASASLRGSAGAPEGDWRMAVAGLSLPTTRSAGLSALSVKASGALADGRTTLDATLDAGKSGGLRLVGSAPLSTAGALDVKATGKLDLALANPVLGVSGRRASGEAAVDLRLQGAPTRPSAQGAITLSHGAFSDEDSGFKVDRIEAALKASGDRVDVSRFTAATPNEGSLSATGTMTLDPAAGFPGALHLTGKHALLASNAIVAATADLAIDIGGPLARSPRATGRIHIVNVDIEIPGRLPSQAIPLPDATHIDPGPTARARLALAAKARAPAGAATPFEAALDLEVDARGGVFVHGRGVDAELSGDLTVTGTSAHPRTLGGFTLRRGTFAILGKQLDFTRGEAAFHGDLVPDLDMLAQTTASGITAMIAVTGSAAKPTFTFSSQPVLAQDEILSRILFDKPSGNLSAVQALQLANAAASLSGGVDTFERLRKSLGVDSLDIGSDASGGATLGVRKAINDRLSVGVTTGARPEDNGVSLDFDLTKRLRLQGGVNAAGGSTTGAGYVFEY